MLNKVIVGLLLLCSYSYANQKVFNLTLDNTIFVPETIDAQTAASFSYELIGRRLSSLPTEPVFIVIASYGGEIVSADLISKIIEQVPNTIIICTYCASSAAKILAHAPSPKYGLKNTYVVFHQLRLRQVFPATLTPQYVKEVQKSSDIFDKYNYSALKMSKEEYLKKVVGKDWELGAEEALKLKLIDEIVKIKCDEYLAQYAINTCKGE